MGSSDLHAESIDHSRFIGAKSQGLEERLLSPEAWWSRGLDLSGQGGVKEALSGFLEKGCWRWIQKVSGGGWWVLSVRPRN